MGKLIFTLSNIFFWLALLFISFISENLFFFSADMKTGITLPTLVMLSIGCLASLFMFYFIEHKENKLKIDFVLLPGIALFGIFLIVGIWLAKSETYLTSLGEEILVEMTFYDKLRATIVCVLFLAFTYAYLFVVHVNKPSARLLHYICYIGIGAAVVSLIFSLCTEMKEYLSIFSDEPMPGLSIDSFYGNKNYYGGVLLIGFLSCIVANYYKPRLYKYLLMIILFVATVASASVLPILISAVALLVYLIEETIYFACKRKWLASVFTTIAIIAVLALISFFYYAVTHPIKGFIGLNVYLTEMLKSKDFLTYTGRTKLWFGLLPRCFDTIQHTIFGHGFMISEKYMIGATAAINDNPLGGVRTAHNGFIELLFNYGLVGTIVFIGMVVYFGYSCVRLLLEKRFHFVFIYSFVVLAMMAHNFCESSPFFDLGVKEIYITFTFMAPVMAKCKFATHKEKVEEIKNLDAEKKELSPKVFGKLFSLILIALTMSLATVFVNPLTYSNVTLRNWMINGIVLLGILLVFLPYLLSLYYRNTDKPMFALHTVANLLLITLVTVLTYLFLKQDATTSGSVKFVVPALLFVLLLLDTLMYAFIKGGSFKEYISVFLGGSFAIPRNAIIGSLISSVIVSLAYQAFNEMNMYIYLVIIVFAFIVFISVFYFLPSKGGKEIIRDYNDFNLYRTKELVIKDESYYG